VIADRVVDAVCLGLSARLDRLGDDQSVSPATVAEAKTRVSTWAVRFVNVHRDDLYGRIR
jgi:hypothetical protein